jgi:hypothetical protein
MFATIEKIALIISGVVLSAKYLIGENIQQNTEI